VVLDVELPDRDVLAVAIRSLDRSARPPVVCTAGSERLALEAFDCEALDCLLKPVEPVRLALALERLRGLVRSRFPEHGQTLTAAHRAGPLDRFGRKFVRDGARLKPLALTEIARISGEDDYAALHTVGRVHLVSLRPSELEARLPRPPFLRVHRSHLVNLDHVERLHRLDEAGLEVVMHDGTTVPVSRARSREIRRMAR
jgi:two-component system, LytTR family, response regulator